MNVDVRKSWKHLQLGLLALALMASASQATENPSKQGDFAASFEYSRDAETLVVAYTEILGELRADEPGPSVAVYGDGRVEVRYPSYMRRAGDYALQLDRAELDRLIHTLVAGGLAELDSRAMRAAVDAARVSRQQARQILPDIQDASTASFELYLERYKPAGVVGGEALPVRQKVSWYAPRWHAQYFPEIAGLAGLAAAEKELRALMQRQDLRRLP